MAKCVKNANTGNFLDKFWPFLGALKGPLVTILLHILVEQVISFKMSGQTSKIRQELPSEMSKQ